MKNIILFCLLAIVATTAWGKPQISEFPADQVKYFEIHNSSGKIEIAATKSKKAVVVVDKKKWSPKCLLKIKHLKSKSTLLVEVEDTSWILENDCEADFIISLPQTVEQDITSGAGDIEIVGTKGSVQLKSGSGDIEIKAEVSSLSAISGSGDLEVDGITSNQATVKSGSGDIKLMFTQSAKGQLDVKSGSGDIEIKYVQKPNGKMNILTGSGDVDISLPKGSTILSELISGSGTTRSEFPNTKEANLKISAKAGSGDLLIKTNQ